MNKDYPVSEGWVKATLTMNKNELVVESEIKSFLATDPAAKEWSPIQQNGKKVTLFFRKKPQTA